MDRETVIQSAQALITRALKEKDTFLLPDLIDNLAEIGTQPQLPLAHAYKVLDCLQVLGKLSPRATVAATRVERRIRLQEV
jgi:hypothetical protein